MKGLETRSGFCSKAWCGLNKSGRSSLLEIGLFD